MLGRAAVAHSGMRSSGQATFARYNTAELSIVGQQMASALGRLFRIAPETDGAARKDGAGSGPHLAWGILFLLLLAVNVVRTLRHAMWRDELQSFQVGTGSRSLPDLLRHFKYEAHGGLWEFLVWLVTHFTSDPFWMQVLHAGLATALWIIVYRWSPFSRAEKFLLLLSYFLFFEYFLVSRDYVLVALLGFGFVATRQYRSQHIVTAWLLLGLLANVVLYSAIWSMAMAAVFAIEQDRRGPAFYAGTLIYLACLAFGIATMVPAADFAPWGGDVRFEPVRLDHALVVPFGAFMPINPEWIVSATKFFQGAGSFVPNIWNPNPYSYASFMQINADHPLRLLIAFAAPLAVCWLIVRDRLRVLEFAITYLGIVAFATLWDFPGSSRHHGIVFLALIAGAWRVRTGTSGHGWSDGTLRAILVVSALGGVLTLASGSRPFSQSRDAAQWLQQNNLADAYLIGSRDAQVSSVAGYLAKPVYYLECQCIGTFIVWNRTRQSPLSAEQFRIRLLRAVDLAAGRQPILISNGELSLNDLAEAPVSVTLLKSFDGPTETDERYWIYRVTKP